ncbi:bifunctional DNA primase/polymerase [Rhodococcus sp. 11-3]|uniref:bifunctional DNA primase/polymerase n=1 Tax=Rhodococcus sp. 11-3 TaxID=2854796 RepID=UPI00203E7148|nr:bifunctional DNA primase/polymerase [Rhodococcus sp. 11-3]USC17014.1 bifunctional DNA primase/polymerase [Rhodococcus sp. 11-3]
MSYADAFEGYWNAGWRSILPLPPGRKYPPPDDRTGYKAVVPSYADVYAWSESQPGANICLRLPEGVVGIDVDAYDGKTGEATLAHAEQLWGTLPPTVRSTARDDGVSGIRLYRVPPGTSLRTQITFPDRGLGGIEVIQYFHRYAVCWPSIHPSGSQYVWLNHLGDVALGPPETDENGVWSAAPFYPKLEELPDLPSAWVEGLGQAAAIVDATADVQQVLSNLRGGKPSQAVNEALAAAINDLRGAGAGSRHDTTMGHVGHLLRLNERGEPGIETARVTLRYAYVSVVGVDRPDAGGEYDRMWTNRRIHDLIDATPTVTDEDLFEMAGITPEEAKKVIDPFGEFWSARDSLRKVFQFAQSQMVSPWSLLGVVMCRALATVPPHVTLPPLVGSPGSLNLFVAVVGKSGHGKGVSMAAARTAFPGLGGFEPDGVYEIEVGSGEGIPAQYVRRETKGEERGTLTWIRKSVLFTVPEVDMVSAQANRSGSTLLSVLKKAWSGESLGNAYRDDQKFLPMPPHSYRLGMVVGVQPRRAADLFADSDGGTPQRFVWLPVIDDAVLLDPPDPPEYPLTTMPGNRWAGSMSDRTMALPEEAKQAIRVHRWKVAKGDPSVDPLDGHALYTRAKVAAALAVLEFRDFVNLDDWELAGVVMAKSDETRRMVLRELSAERREKVREMGRAKALETVATEEALEETADERVTATRERIVELVRERGPLSAGRIKIDLSRAQRKVTEEAFEGLLAGGVLEVRDGRYCLPE